MKKNKRNKIWCNTVSIHYVGWKLEQRSNGR